MAGGCYAEPTPFADAALPLECTICTLDDRASFRECSDSDAVCSKSLGSSVNPWLVLSSTFLLDAFLPFESTASTLDHSIDRGSHSCFSSVQSDTFSDRLNGLS